MPSLVHTLKIAFGASAFLVACAWGADAVAVPWDRAAARNYLDGRLVEWMAWSESREAGGGGTRCISCHTAVPIGLAGPALGGASPAHRALLTSIRTRVGSWEAISAWNGEAGAVRPFYSFAEPGTRKEDALATESVLNALVLTHADAGSESARQALKNMWSMQNPRGAWNWLDFGLKPWELDSEYLGAAWAAVAVGRAGSAYRDGLDDADLARLGKLRSYLQSHYLQQPLHHRLAALWASSLLPEVLTSSQRHGIVDEVLALNSEGDGWALPSLAKKSDNAEMWRRTQAIPPDATEDGYATAYVMFVLRQSEVGANNPRLQRAAAWLVRHKVPLGQGPAIYLNDARDPSSTDPEKALVGKFMHDAAAAYAVMALDE